MDWQKVRYLVPLRHRPRIMFIAVGVHQPSEPKKHINHPGYWYAHIYGYEADICINGQWLPIRPGDAGVIPPEADVSYRFRGRSSHLYAHFCFDATSEPVAVPAIQPLGQRYLPLSDRFYEAINSFNANPSRAEARLWDILWEFAEPNRAATDPPGVPHPGMHRVCEMIEQYMARPLSVPFLADHADMSANHLTRLFRQHLDTTVVAYVRRRRALRAKHLLLHSSLPLKEIARQVGVPDPHRFNKVIRQELGASPRRVREQSGNRG